MGGLKNNRKWPPHRLTSGVKNRLFVMVAMTVCMDCMEMMNFPPRHEMQWQNHYQIIHIMFQTFFVLSETQLLLRNDFPLDFIAYYSTVHEIIFYFLRNYIDQHAYLCASRCFNFKKAKKFYTERSSNKQKYRWLVH